MANIEVIDFGISRYREIWSRQKSLFEELVNLKREHRQIETQYLLIGEHPAVYTLGFHGNASNLLVSESRLHEMGAECIRIERGGDITYHGPGQMIAYPIFDLESLGIGIKGYMDLLEDSVIELLAGYGIRGDKVDGAIGIWIGKDTPGERKICAMGVKSSRYVTMHGLALNVSTDLSAFSAINPCGFVDKGVTSMERELGYAPEMAEVKNRFAAILVRRSEELSRIKN